MRFKTILFLSFTFISSFIFGQSIIDSCFTSVTPTQNYNFQSSLTLANVHSADMLEWNGTNWYGGFSGANLTLPPPTGAIGCRAIFLGNSIDWTTGGESIGLKLTSPLISGETYSFDITYVSHGLYSDGNFSPFFYTSLAADLDLATLVGNLPAVGNDWTTNTLSFTATPAQAGHLWIIIGTDPDGTSGLVSSFCLDCIDPSYIDCDVNLGNDTTLCAGESLTLNVSKPFASYLWSDNSTDPIFTITEEGTYWVELTVDTCTTIDSISVSFRPVPLINLGNDTTICEPGNVLSLDVTTPNATYLWQDNSTNSIFTVSEQGAYWVEVLVNNCSAFDTINVYFGSPNGVHFGNDTTLCDGETLVLDAYSPNGNYLWQDGTMQPTLTVSEAGSYWVELTVNSCSYADAINVNYNPLPSINLGNDIIICHPDSTVTLNAFTTGASYLWQDNSTNSVYTVSENGIYFVEVTLNNCSAMDTVIVSYGVPAPLSLGNDTTLCEGEILVLDVKIPNGSYLWNNNSTGPNLTVLEQGSYWVELSLNTCISSDTIYVTYNPLPHINLGNDTTICQSAEGYTLDATTPNATYLWQDNSTNPIFNVVQDGTYIIEVMVNKCGSRSIISIQFEDCEINLVLPNVFTPNNDGMNELFSPLANKGILSMNTMIYNRWGTKIFDTNNPLIEWDGNEVSNGIYFWIIYYVDKYEIRGSQSGYVTLLK